MGRHGFFISMEGVEGTGKSTQCGLLKKRLESEGHKVVLTKEPGGTPIGDEIRRILLSTEHSVMDPITELLLYFASRRQHMTEVIVPALERGEIVITDRFVDSTTAYQGYARGIDLSLIESLNRTVTSGTYPDLTVLLELEVEEGLNRNKDAGKMDRLELEDLDFHMRVSEGFRIIAWQEQQRIKTVSAVGTPKDVHERINTVVHDAMNKLAADGQ